MKKKRREEKLTEEEVRKREPYKFTAFVTGPLIKYEISARDFDEAYRTGIGLLLKQLEDYRGEVVIEKVEVLRYTDLPF
jgi:hypothetical protein